MTDLEAQGVIDVVTKQGEPRRIKLAEKGLAVAKVGRATRRAVQVGSVEAKPALNGRKLLEVAAVLSDKPVEQFAVEALLEHPEILREYITKNLLG